MGKFVVGIDRRMLEDLLGVKVLQTDHDFKEDTFYLTCESVDVREGWIMDKLPRGDLLIRRPSGGPVQIIGIQIDGKMLGQAEPPDPHNDLDDPIDWTSCYSTCDCRETNRQLALRIATEFSFASRSSDDILRDAKEYETYLNG